MRPPGRQIAAGRDADIFDYGPGLVLRRSRSDRSLATEARMMAHVRELGYPAPAVVELSGDERDLVMERIDGPDMVVDLRRRPWLARRHGALLADLHRRLHALAAPAWAGPPPVGEGDALVHMDLHPMNVILGPQGPVVIDWTNARRGDPGIDVALTWALIGAGEVPATGPVGLVASRIRGALLRSFLGGVDAAAARAWLRPVVAWKVQDRNISPKEQAAMWRLVAAEGDAG